MRGVELNHRPTDYESIALPLSYPAKLNREKTDDTLRIDPLRLRLGFEPSIYVGSSRVHQNAPFLKLRLEGVSIPPLISRQVTVLVRAAGFEPATSEFQTQNSTTELRSDAYR